MEALNIWRREYFEALTMRFKVLSVAIATLYIEKIQVRINPLKIFLFNFTGNN